MTVILIIVAVVIVLGLIVGLGFIAPRNRRGSLEPPSKRRTLVDDRVVPPEEVERAALVEAEVAADLATHVPVDDVVVEEVAERPRFRDRLGKARAALSGAMGSIAGRSKIDAETWDELEEALILADVGVGSTQELLDHLRARVKVDGLSNGEELLGALKAEMADRLSGFDRELKLSSDSGPTVWLFVGVNGVGKTTTIGKIGVRHTISAYKAFI